MGMGLEEISVTDNRQDDDLFGYAEATLDKVGRFMMPSEFYDRMKDRGRMRMTVDPCGNFLELRTEAKFKALVNRVLASVSNLSPDVAQSVLIEYLGYSMEVQFDTSYRLTIPKRFRDEILGEESELVLIGSGDALLIWAKSVFKATQKARRERLGSEYPALLRAIYGIPQPQFVVVKEKDIDA